MKKKEKQNILLIVAALAAFVCFMIIYISLGIEERNRQNIAPGSQGTEDKYYFNEDFKDEDPLVSKNPNLRQMLAGPIISANDPLIGDKSAPVSIVIFSDFECSYCYNEEQIIKRILDDYKYYTKLIWKDYPESDTGSPSYRAAVAARCAFDQGQFWPFHDFLFNSNGNLTDDNFMNIAKILKLDKGKFEKCLESGEQNAKIDDNIEEASALEISGIPFIYVNNQEILGEITYEDLKRIVEIELKK